MGIFVSYKLNSLVKTDKSPSLRETVTNVTKIMMELEDERSHENSDEETEGNELERGRTVQDGINEIQISHDSNRQKI